MTRGPAAWARLARAVPGPVALGVGALVAVLLALASWLKWIPPTPVSPSAVAPPGDTRALNIATNPGYAGACPVLAAQARGYFKAEGLAVNLQLLTSGRAALERVMQGGADLATVTDLPVMFAATRGQPVVVVANLFRAERDNGIVGRRDRGIVHPIDLKGRRIGLARGTSAHFTLDALLHWNGLAHTDVELVDLAPEALADALLQGRVDAVATWQPNLNALAQRLGANGSTVFDGERVYSANYLLAGTRARVQQLSTEVRAVLRALMHGAAYCNDMPVAAAGLLAMPEGADPSSLQRLWAGYRFGVSLQQSLLLALEHEAEWAISEGLTPGPAPNFLDHVDLRVLEAVRPSAITIIH